MRRRAVQASRSWPRATAAVRATSPPPGARGFAVQVTCQASAPCHVIGHHFERYLSGMWPEALADGLTYQGGAAESTRWRCHHQLTVS